MQHWEAGRMICQNFWRISLNTVDEEGLASSDAPASIFREPLHQEFSRKVVSGRHGVFTHFPKDRNCEGCERTRITRAPCRNCIDNPVLRAAILVT